MKRSILALLVLLLVGIALAWFWHAPVSHSSNSHNSEIRAAIDIGSGATNLKVAEVDPKTNKIVVELFEKSIPVPYQKQLEQSTDQMFDQSVMDQGIHTVQVLKDLAAEHQARKVIAVATAAFRAAKNGPEFAREIEEVTGVPVRIINQEEEGILAFRGALALTPVAPEHAVAWDIGGGSMQLTTLTPAGTYLVEKGQTASIPFKNYVIQQIERKDAKLTQSPNPMSEVEMEAAIQHAAHLAQGTGGYMKEKLQDPETQILAVGNLFNRSIKPLVQSEELDSARLAAAVMHWVDKRDAELPGGPLAEVAVTNPLLVLGYMQGLKVTQVEIVNVNNTDGALTYPAYWS